MQGFHRIRSRCVAVLLAGVLATLVGCDTFRPAQLTVWAADEGDLVTPDTPAATENDVYSASRRRITLSSAINETVALQLVVRASEAPAGPYDLRFTDLTGPAGVLHAADTFRVYRAHLTLVEQFHSWYADHTSRPAVPTAFFDALVPWEAPQGGGPLRIGDTGNQLLWVDLRVPPTAEPGVYRGRLALAPMKGDVSAFVADIELSVAPIALPTAPTLPALCRVDPHDLLAAQLKWTPEPSEQLRLLRGDTGSQRALRVVDGAMRLLHEHRAAPVLWAAFPPYRMLSERELEVDWESYDALVAPWIDGSAYADRVGAPFWPLPASLTHPDADRNGGARTPRYARVLGAYLKACEQHFAERGWSAQPIFRPIPPTALGESLVARLQYVAGVVQQQGVDAPLVAHVPARSLRGLGWRDAPDIDLRTVGVWAPPAGWLEPTAMAQQRALGKSVWLFPDHPPFSGSLAVESDPNDVRTLPWEAQRYDLNGLWIEHAADVARQDALLAAGHPFGLDTPVPTIRLKRLRRGLQDCELLRLLELAGMRALAARVAEQVVRYGGVDAVRDYLISTLPAGWPQSPRTLRLARLLLMSELAASLEPNSVNEERQAANRTVWRVLLSEADRIRIDTRGVRLTQEAGRLSAHIAVDAMNLSDDALIGHWRLPNISEGWTLTDGAETSLPPQTRRATTLDVALDNLSYGPDGAIDFDVRLDTETAGAFDAAARLAIAAAPRIPRALTIDGRLDDWPLFANNIAGDFRLCRGRRPLAATTNVFEPTLPTRARFCTDGDAFFVAIECVTPTRERTVWSADNRFPVDGATPWEQDVVEVLLSPENAQVGTPSDLLLLRVKPNGAVMSTKGCATEPPVADVRPWNCNAAVAVSHATGAWVVEIAIPLTSLGPAAQNALWGVNVTRLDAKRGEYSSWSGARGHCYAPETLGNVFILR